MFVLTYASGWEDQTHLTTFQSIQTVETWTEVSLLIGTISAVDSQTCMEMDEFIREYYNFLEQWNLP